MFNKYPYTDNNQLNLDWFLKTFKELYDGWVEFKAAVEEEIEDFETAIRNDFQDLKDDYDGFKLYVESYLENLDYITAVENYIDELIADGTLVQALQPTIATEVTDWLNDNVTPVGSAVIVDASLTIPGAAADAAETGTLIRGLDARTDHLESLTENTRNMWIWGDQHADGAYVDIRGNDITTDILIPAGTYTLSAIATTTATNKNTRIQFYTAGLGSVIAEPYITADGQRHAVTFTLSADCYVIYVLAGLSTTSSYDVTWSDIQLEAGTRATPYIEPYSDIDNVARVPVTENLWVFDDIQFEKSYTQNINLKAGKYTFSAIAEPVGETYEPIGYRVEFKAGSTVVAVNTISGLFDSSFIVDLSSDVDNMILYSSNTSSNATGHTSKWTKIQIIKGAFNKSYLPAALDLTDMINYISTDPDLIMEIDNWEFTKRKNINVIRKNKNPGNILIECSAKWEDPTNTGLIPEIQFEYYGDGRNVTNWYTLGTEGYYTDNQWRLPAFPGYTDINKENYFRIGLNIPTGLVVTIKHLSVRYDNTVYRPFNTGLRIDTHLDFMNYPSLSIHALKAAARCGATHCIVIPKRSSDGVWFAYHDDTFDESTTILRNSDGSTITGSGYNGQPFSNIPWSWLETLDAGIYRDQIWAGTKLMKISEMLEICNRTGIHPVFSCHPYYNAVETQSLYDLVESYNMLDKLTILPDDTWFSDHAWTIFGNDIEMYKFSLTRGNTDMLHLNNLISFINGYTALDKNKVAIALWCDQTSDALITAITTAGFKAGLHEYSHTSTSGQTVTPFTGDDVKTWQGKGVYVFTDTHNPSIGLDW